MRGRPKTSTKVTINCAQCGKEMVIYPSQQRKGTKYCSRSCAITARNLTDANPSYHRDISGEKNPMYGKGMKGEANPMYGKRNELSPSWKGGRYVRPDGYVVVQAPDDHPFPCTVKKSGFKYILEHRHVMEQHLGRYLMPWEVVHHKDENKSNNAIENLELLTNQSEHVKQKHAFWTEERKQRMRETTLRRQQPPPDDVAS